MINLQDFWEAIINRKRINRLNYHAKKAILNGSESEERVVI